MRKLIFILVGVTLVFGCIDRPNEKNVEESTVETAKELQQRLRSEKIDKLKKKHFPVMAFLKTIDESKPKMVYYHLTKNWNSLINNELPKYTKDGSRITWKILKECKWNEKNIYTGKCEHIEYIVVGTHEKQHPEYRYALKYRYSIGKIYEEISSRFTYNMRDLLFIKFPELLNEL